jgi:hypothetical protein
MIEADKSRLLDLWASGATASEIADELGVTRNAVIGQVTRTRAKGDARAVSRAPSRPRKPTILPATGKSMGGTKPGRKALARAKKPQQSHIGSPGQKTPDACIVPSPPPVLEPTRVELPRASEPVPLIDCRPGCCRWPVSQDQRGHLFCDAPVEPGQRPQWCAEHRAIGFSARAA